nr:hypothetical protein [Rhizobium sp. Leaf453]
MPGNEPPERSAIVVTEISDVIIGLR